MSNISLVEAKLPPGFRFHPRDEELVCDYLMKKVASTDTLQLMIEVDINKCEPWDIPETALVGGKEWYFYSQRDRKYATGLRKNRATASGYWKATGKDRTILSKDTLVGMRKTLVFYQGRAPKGQKTDWVMHEFRLEGPLSPPNISTLEDWVLCRVFCKSREIISKHSSMGSCYDDTGSSSLPPLMDSYIIFDQNQPNLDDIYDNHDGDDDVQQVPCFSINLSQNQSNPTSLEDMMITNHQHHHHMEPNIIPPTTKTLTSSSSADEQIPMNNVASCLDSFPSDKKVINAVLNHLNQLDTYLNVKESPSFEGGSSDQSYLAGLALPNIWN